MSKENLKILYEDNHIIVVVKPVGMPVQQDKSEDMDLLSTVKNYIKEKYNKPGNVYVGLVHRLDRMVGGVMVFAKTSKAASRLSEYIRTREVKKRYIAIVNGKLEMNKKVITLENYLVKNERLNMSEVTSKESKNAKLALLEYSVKKNVVYNNKDYCVMDINLLSGRHHQIRVQFANMLHPLYGDIKYGQKINKVGQKLALWAYHLEFFHPTKDEILKFEYFPTEKEDKIWSVIN
ncbi:MAG: RNA pseudouridine synthase [Clostridia bacterium]